jgi:hypothetical protein
MVQARIPKFIWLIGRQFATLFPEGGWALKSWWYSTRLFSINGFRDLGMRNIPYGDRLLIRSMGSREKVGAQRTLEFLIGWAFGGILEMVGVLFPIFYLTWLGMVHTLVFGMMFGVEQSH